MYLSKHTLPHTVVVALQQWSNAVCVYELVFLEYGTVYALMYVCADYSKVQMAPHPSHWPPSTPQHTHTYTPLCKHQLSL